MNYVQKEMKECFHSKSTGLLLFALLAFCLLMLVSRLLPEGMLQQENVQGQKTQAMFTLGVVDQEQDVYTEILLEYFREDDAFSSYVDMQVGEEEEIRRLFDAGKLDGWVRIPEDFVSGMIAIEHVPLTITLSTEDTTKAVLLQNLFRSYGYYVEAVETGCMTLYRQMEQSGAGQEQLEAANWQISLELIMGALGRTDFFEYEEQAENGTIPLLYYYGFSLVGLLPFLLTIPAGMRLVEERKRGILARIRITDGGLWRWLGAKMLVQGTLTVMSILVMGELLRWGLGYSWIELEAGLSVVMICVGIITVLMACAFLTADRREYLLVTGMLVLLLAMFGGSFLPVELLSEKLAQVAEWMPNRLLASMLMKAGN